MIKNAELSKCREYRYALWRTWDERKPYALIVGLNPSKANETEDDPTINRCINYAKEWGYGGLCMANLFAYRATDPKDLKLASNPIGDENDVWLKKLSDGAGVVVAAWGNDGSFNGRSEEIRNMLPNLHYLKLNESGEPAHPLYLSGDLKPVTW
ncbi:MAG: DUF1643 domain-containing protein [Alphaproteobacteria bacterium]|nr:DUF1643 domain-containing protein [Alphaproteobacteria bacterium]